MEGDKLPNQQTMFKFLMYRDGRGAEYEERLADAVAKDGKWGAKARQAWSVMRDMGWQRGSQDTKRRYMAAIAEDGLLKKEVQSVENTTDIEAALSQIPNLPAVASPALELEWVGGHPAMMRKDLHQGPKELLVVITPVDVLQAPHGLPPSRRAVAQLVHWSNRPQKFHEQILGINKKAEYVGAEAGTHEEAQDLTLQELRDLIKQFAHGKRPDWS